MRVVLTISVAALAVLGGLPGPAVAQTVAAWEEWQHLPGVVDVAGARSDGNLVVVAAGRLYLLSPDSGTITPFAAGPDGFAGSVDGEPYAVVTPALPPGEACSFEQDDVYVLDLTSPPGVARVDPAGHASRFATLSDVDTLNGIAVDTTGRFGSLLLVAGARQTHEMVFAIDCQGGVTSVTTSAPAMEGGLAVAPPTFGAYAGDLIGADENSGQVWAIEPDGTASVVATPNLPTGGDTGVESLGFVPPGFTAGGGGAYLADRGTANNPFPGTDSVLRLSAEALLAAGVQEGDLLAATEGGGTTVAIHCEASCTVVTVAAGPAAGNIGHIEGHLILVVTEAPG